MTTWSTEKLLEIATRGKDLCEPEAAGGTALVKEWSDRAVRRSLEAQACAEWMAMMGVKELKYVGPFGRHGLTVGDMVQVRSGARVYSTKGSVPKLGVVTLRAKTVRVSKITDGWVKWDGEKATVCNPLITWAGKSGYWCWCDANNVERFGAA
jgi:hypothetical protein